LGSDCRRKGLLSSRCNVPPGPGAIPYLQKINPMKKETMKQ
jgi:hypothetical protein